MQETAFAMCVEVTERALSLTGKREVLLVGGVGANRRLQEMLRIMCEERGARFFVPEQKYLGDNGAMIAYTGKLMLQCGETLPVELSRINPSFRSDEVDVTWKNKFFSHLPENDSTRSRGAEAIITFTETSAEKRRVVKPYRVAPLDLRLITERTRAEAKLISAARRAGVPTPVIQDITHDSILMEKVEGTLLKDSMTEENLVEAGRMVGKLHSAGIVHGDLTTSNVIIRKDDLKCVFIDFGLAQITSEIEQQGVDIRVLFQTLESTHPDNADILKSAFVAGYTETFEGAQEAVQREHDIEQRGRYL
jgi:N6-L-threonylcarbamoyladenine synthase/protein kinase Bud32